jgi:ribosomal protein S27E
MQRCPHCGQSGISFTRKMFLGPAIPASCRVCGKLIGVPWSAMLVVFADLHNCDFGWLCASNLA